ENSQKLMTFPKKTTIVLSTVLTWAAISTSGTRTFLPSAIAPSAAIAQMEEAPPETTLPEAAPADFQPASRERIEELLALIEADTMSDQILGQLVGQFRQLAPEVPDEWWDRFIAKALESDINSLLIPIYERNYSAEEVDGLIEFYESPVGQSLLAKTPTVTQESIVAGQAWGMEIAEELITELEADGYEFPAGPSASPEAPEPEPTELPAQETMPESSPEE
ncbi:MAG: DUF2059 domain-containing protein, partial [Cyanobacteria bacterium J06555_13]